MALSPTQRYYRRTTLESWHGDACHICGLSMRQDYGNHPLDRSVDHIKPKSHGGNDHIDNLLLAHRICNRVRGNRRITNQLRDLCMSYARNYE